MTFAFGSLTLGLILIYTAFKNSTVGEILRGEEDKDGEPVSFLGESAAATLASFDGSSSGASSSRYESGGIGPGSTRIPKNIKGQRGTKTWVNPDGSKEQIASWIYYELIRLKAKGKIHVNSGYRTYAEQVEACKHASPCATPGTSNHEKKVFPGGAIDVQNYDELNKLIRRNGGSLLKWYGPGDVWHFSATGR